ncbi:DNA repair protein RadA [Lacipirellula limnantheis]|uniref:DNA repair protein RadA n=2 Tax=Lacipirellula limnantheis TaxID=2528024 RepID=A0A517TVR8_9BACT|nr:DNA repair protein RadA [Lacipirellula limnantheis]
MDLNAASQAVRSHATPQLVCLSNVVPRAVDWLWRNRIAVGKVTLLAGDPGLGKSFVSLDIASRVSTGAPWPDEPDVTRTPADVILLSGEDALDDTVRPRVDAMGADCDRIKALQGIIVSHSRAGDPERGVDLSKDIAALDEAMDQMNDCKLVVIDPISVYLGDANSNDNGEVRRVLSGLTRFAERRNVAVLLITHLRKGEGSPINRVIGSIGFVAAARAGLIIVKDPQNHDRRLMLPLKNNIAPDNGGLAYSIPREGDQSGTVCWEPDPVLLDAGDVLATPPKRRGPCPGVRDHAKAWLLTFLKEGPQPTATIAARAKECGISEATLRRAREELGVTSTKWGHAFWWQLPDNALALEGVDGQQAQPEQLDGPDDGWA